MNAMEQLINFVERLREARIHFKLACVRDAIMVEIPSPSRHYEVEFFADGNIEMQTFGPASNVRNVTLPEITTAVIADVNGEQNSN